MKYLTVKQAAHALGLATSTLNRHVYTTKLFSPFVAHPFDDSRIAFDAASLPKMRAAYANAPASGRSQLTRRETEKRQDRALALQEKGYTRSQIAKMLGYKHASAVTKAIHAATRREIKKLIDRQRRTQT